MAERRGERAKKTGKAKPAATLKTRAEAKCWLVDTSTPVEGPNLALSGMFVTYGPEGAS